jgi:hypothetical protein
MKLVLITILYTFVWAAYCVVPVRLDAQLVESQGVIIGIVEQIEESDQSLNALEYVVGIKLVEWIGFIPNDSHKIKLHIPLNIEDEQSSVLPKILVGENIAGIIKIENGKYYLANSAQSKFNIKKIGSMYYFVNDAFPYHPQIGQIASEHFKKAVAKHFNGPFKANKIKPSESQAKNLKRDIASRIETKTHKEQYHFSSFWLLALLAGLSILASQLRLKQNKK